MRKHAILFGVLMFCGCSSATSGGDSGKATFAYANVTLGGTNVSHPMLVDSSVTVTIQLQSSLSTATLRVASEKPDIFTVDSAGRGNEHVGMWQAQLTGHMAGSAKLQLFNAVTNDPIDTISIGVATPAKIEAPSDVSLSVGDRQTITMKVKDASGNELHASYALEWTLDQDFAVFDYLSYQQGQSHMTGDVVVLKGAHPGPTTMHGRVGDVRIDVPVNVK
jgi:hypothetical protein